MADDKQKLIEQFCAISGVDQERSKFYLESAAWNIETALGSLYEEGEDNSPGPAESEKKTGASTEKGANMPWVSKFDSESSDEEGQAFYAGGSEHSGQQVIGPSKKKKDVVSMLFKSAKEHGAEVLESRDKASGKTKLTFAGTGYRLGETESDHEVVSGGSDRREEEPRDVALRLWRSGFTVDDGPLRRYDDAANLDFLNSVRRGQVPPELARRGAQVFISMEDHRHEDFVPSKAKREAFTGAGHALGSPAPAVIGQVTDTGTPGGSTGRPATTTATSSGGAAAGAQIQAQQPAVDEQSPVTNVQLRLPDGSRLVLKLNHTHTVGDIRRFASSARPQLPPSFAIMTTFPYAELTDDAKTIADANILNSALVLK